MTTFSVLPDRCANPSGETRKHEKEREFKTHHDSLLPLNATPSLNLSPDIVASLIAYPTFPREGTETASSEAGGGGGGGGGCDDDGGGIGTPPPPPCVDVGGRTGTIGTSVVLCVVGGFGTGAGKPTGFELGTGVPGPGPGTLGGGFFFSRWCRFY
jgi:hypothetical protein